MSPAPATSYARTDSSTSGAGDQPPVVTTRDIQSPDRDQPPVVTARDVQPSGHAAPVRAGGGGGTGGGRAGAGSGRRGGGGGPAGGRGGAPAGRGGGGGKAGGGKPRGGGAGGGAAGGGGAGGGGADPLSRWKASAAAATGAVPGPDLADPAAAPAQLAGQAQQLDQQRRVTRPDFAQDAKATLQAPPAEPPREKVLDTGPADAAVSAVEKAAAGRLSDQRFPPAQPMPVYPGGRAGGGATPAIPAAARGPAPGPGGPAGGGATALDPKADEVRTKVAAVTPTAAGGGTPQPIVLQDKGAASLTPRSPAQGQQIGDVLAKVKLKVDTYAQEFVTAAAAKLDPRHNVGKLTDRWPTT